MTLTRNLLFYNKFISFFITLLLLMEYPFYFKQKNKKHFSLQRNALTLKC
ncbi:hypothetical protein BLGI_561 [Brevibacillus laterosporus GI-9]|nr:hypothetical protein BLGI_561 [Brevibacillus laterosporus GI-9]